MSLFPPRKAESFDFKEVQYEKRDWVARVTINRPHNYNAYSTPALQELAVSIVSRDRFAAEVTIDGRAQTLLNLTDLVVKNTLIFAGYWVVDPDSRHDDGQMEIVPFHGIGDWTSRVIVNHRKFPFREDAMERIGLTTRSKILKGSDIKVQLLRPESEETLPAEVDGEEFFSANLFNITVHPRLLQLIIPEHPQWI